MHAAFLQVNAITNPIGFFMTTPRLSWRMEAEGTNRRQTACQIQVSLDDSFATCLLDTGKVQTEQSIEWPLELALSPMIGRSSLDLVVAFQNTYRCCLFRLWRLRLAAAPVQPIPYIRFGIAVA